MVNIQIIIGSTRVGRYSEKPAQWLYNEMKLIDNISVDLVDLRDFPLPFFNEPKSPMALTVEHEDPAVRKWQKKVAEADAFIIIAPEYNHGYTAVLKNALDYLYKEWNNKPVGFLSYGGTGGARVVEQLRSVVIELQMHPIKQAIHIPMELYIATMNSSEPAVAFNKALKDNNRNSFALLTNQLIDLARKLKL